MFCFASIGSRVTREEHRPSLLVSEEHTTTCRTKSRSYQKQLSPGYRTHARTHARAHGRTHARTLSRCALHCAFFVFFFNTTSLAPQSLPRANRRQPTTSASVIPLLPSPPPVVPRFRGKLQTPDPWRRVYIVNLARHIPSSVTTLGTAAVYLYPYLCETVVFSLDELSLHVLGQRHAHSASLLLGEIFLDPLAVHYEHAIVSIFPLAIASKCCVDAAVLFLLVTR